MMLPSRLYESNLTKFIRELKVERPELDREQQNGRAIWWDKPPRDLDERRKMDEGLVQQQAYVYQNKV
ncbi:MAG: DUF3460 family protein [Casimicrobiaceae bacterium]